MLSILAAEKSILMGPKWPLRKSEIVFFDDFSVGTAQDDFILGQVATNRLYLS